MCIRDRTLTDYTAATVQYSVADGSEKVSKAYPLSLNDTLTRLSLIHI